MVLSRGSLPPRSRTDRYDRATPDATARSSCVMPAFCRASRTRRPKPVSRVINSFAGESDSSVQGSGLPDGHLLIPVTGRLPLLP